MAATGFEIDLDLPITPEARVAATLASVSPTIPDDAFAMSDDIKRWPAGITWLPWGIGNITTAPSDCVTQYAKTARELPAVVVQPAFLLHDALTCSTLGPSLQLLARRVETNLDVYASAAFAAELETATQSGGVGLVGNATYTPAVASGTAVGLQRAFFDLEDHLATTLHGALGVIHLPAGLLTVAEAATLVTWRDGAFRTSTGHAVIGDAGHRGTAAPEGQSAAAAGERWIYASGPVLHRIGEIERMDSDVDGDSQVFIEHNDNRPLRERYGVVAFDPATLGAALVTLPS
jgi:hypothetical protein